MNKSYIFQVFDASPDGRGPLLQRKMAARLWTVAIGKLVPWHMNAENRTDEDLTCMLLPLSLIHI